MCVLGFVNVFVFDTFLILFGQLPSFLAGLGHALVNFRHLFLCVSVS